MGTTKKSRQKRERQKAVSEVSDIERKNAEFARFQFLTGALIKIQVLWAVKDIKAT